jgi:toxin FitB
VSYLLDTNVISEIRKKRPEPLVRLFLEQHPMYEMYLSVITLGELKQGALRAPLSLQADLNQWIERQRIKFDNRVLPLDETVMDVWASITAKAILAGSTPPLLDSLIAATALYHALIVVTRNVDDFCTLGVKTINPWSSV